MRNDALSKLGLAVFVIGLTACSDPNTPATSLDDRIQPAVAASCELVKTMSANVRDFFIQPEQKVAQDQLRLLGESCSAGNQSLTTARSWQLLGLMETVLNQHRANSTAAGNLLVNKLLACTLSLCTSAAQPNINFTGALSTYGLFAIGGADSDDAVSRDPQPFNDFQGHANTALWGVEVDAPWSTVTGAHSVLVYGNPESSLSLQELHIGNLRYDLKTFPDVSFADGLLHVGVCLASEVDLPPVGADQPEARMRREGVLLEEHVPGFCPPPAVQSASIFASISSIARRFIPTSLSVLFAGDTKAGAVGGTPLDFSRFAPVASKTTGALEFVVGPNPVVVAGQSIGTIQVRARSGDGTPMERVLVTLTIRGNNGEPAGAFLSGDLSSFTQEANGAIAVFPDDGNPVVVGKAGGYRLCANASFGGFTFNEICSAVFNARNP
ncbi:MAG: hypothetical protein ACRENP_21495 [Longimicrobiales bacterium]